MTKNLLKHLLKYLGLPTLLINLFKYLKYLIYHSA